MQRVLQPELLDSLAPDDPAALRNRRELRVLNQAVGNWRWFARVLPALMRPGERVLEVGAGLGELGCLLAGRGLAVDGLDVWPRAPGWLAGARWHQEDVTQFEGWRDYPVVIGNLIWHQFGPGELAEIGARMRAAGLRVFVASEPARHRFFQSSWAVLSRLLGAGAVSRHDGYVSVAAGFRRLELARALGFDGAAWQARGWLTPLGMNRLVVQRIGEAR